MGISCWRRSRITRNYAPLAESRCGMPFNKRVTRSLVELVGLSPRCQQFTDYWFSVWEGNKLPTAKMFAPIAKLKPFILMLERRLDGSAKLIAVGEELARAGAGAFLGAHWVSHAPHQVRSEMQRRGAAIARGAILRTNREVHLQDNSVHHFETVTVPLRSSQTSTVLAVLVDWQVPAGSVARVSPAELARLPEIAEFIPIVENMPDKPETELVGKALQHDERVKIISRAAIRYMLNFMGDTMASAPESPLDATDYLIALAIGSANVSHIDNDAAQSRKYAGLIEPDSMRRGISRAAIARATMLPVETVRRRVNNLIEKKVLVQRKDGIILSATNPLKLGARLDRMHAHAHLTERMIRDLKACGVTFA